MHLRHKWITVEAIGNSHTQRCSVCGKTRVRVINPRKASRPDTPGGPRR